MATYYCDISNAYNTASVLHDGTTVHPFCFDEIDTLVSGAAVNGIALAGGDTLRMRGEYVAAFGISLFEDTQMSLVLRAWEDGVPWKMLAEDSSGLCVFYLGNATTTLDIYDGVFSAIRTGDNQTGCTISMYNCTMYGGDFRVSNGFPGTVAVNCCTFKDARIRLWGRFNADRGDITFTDSVFENSYLDEDDRWNSINFTGRNFSTQSQADFLALTSPVILTGEGTVDWSYAFTSPYPDYDDFSQEDIAYSDYGLPFYWIPLAIWTTNGVSEGWWEATRRGFGAFSFVLADSFSMTPTSGSAPLKVSYDAEIPGGSSWSWEFGDGETSSAKSGEHTYSMPGEYTVVATAIDADGNILTSYFTVYVYDFDYSGDVPNSSLSTVCYRLPVRGNEGFGVAEYTDSLNEGSDWIWPPANVQISNGYDIQKREIALVLDSKTQREYQINDPDTWRDRVGTYEGNQIISEIHGKAYESQEGEHIPIRHIEHHEYFKSFDRKNMQDAAGYDSEGLPVDMLVDNSLYVDGEPFTPTVTARSVQIHGDLVFQEKVEARNLQLRTKVYGAPYMLTGISPYFETVDKQSSPSLRVMTEDGFQSNLASMPLFHVSRSFGGLLNLATGADVTGSFAAQITGPDGFDYSALTFGAADYLVDTCPDGTSVSGNFSVYVWANNIIPAVLPIQLYAFQNLSVEIHQFGAIYQIVINHNGTVFTADLDFLGTQWTLFTVVREGLFLRVYENKTLLDTFVVPLASDLGNTLYFAPAGQISLFDPCVLPRAISLDDITYYYDNVIRGGGEVLQPF